MNSIPPHKPRHVWRFVLLALAIIGIGVYWLSYGRSHLFIWSWSDRLQTLGNLPAIENYSQVHDLAPLHVQRFPSGEWVAVAMEHACCSGAGFNATIFHDSAGATYIDTTHSFCGMEGLGAELHQVEANSLAAFYPQLRQLKLLKR